MPADGGFDSSRPLRPTRWCVLISGRGSNLAAVLENPSIDVALVVSTDAAAPGLTKARRSGIPTVVAAKKTSGSIDWETLHIEISRRQVDAIFLLGFMRIVPSRFIEKWAGRILNLHPSLLPLYPGLKSIERAFTDGADCGASVHVVVPEVDAGPVLAKRRSLNSRIGIQTSEKLDLVAVETLVHIDEQRLVRSIATNFTSAVRQGVGR